ncbi:MAG: hypothetical protein AAF787_01085 [Chloroflexota bacterium]
MKMITIVTTVLVLALGVTAVGAQDNGRSFRRGGGELVLEYTGLTHEELRDAVQNGSTLAELIEANGQSVDAFVDAAVAQAEERLDAAVEAGRLTADEAAEKAAQLETNIEARLNGTFERNFDGEGRRGPRGNGPRGGAGAEADADV